MDIPEILDIIRKGAKWTRAENISQLTNSWADQVQTLPTQAELEYAWENVDSKYVLTTDATDTVTPHAGVPDILADGVASCTITVTKKKRDDTVLTTPTFFPSQVLTGSASAGSDVVVPVTDASEFEVGQRIRLKEGATEEGTTVKAVGVSDITVDLTNSYTVAATCERCVEHNDTVYFKTTGGKLSAESISLAEGTGSVVLTSVTETKIVKVTAWDGDGKGVKLGEIKIQFRV